MRKWLSEHNGDDVKSIGNKKRTVKVDVSFLESKGNNERG
jgi:hypothetical protein